MTPEEKEILAKLKEFHRDRESLKELIYQNDGQNLAVATSDGSICLGLFSAAFEESLMDMERVLDAYNALPSLLGIIERQEREIKGLKNELRAYHD